MTASALAREIVLWMDGIGYHGPYLEKPTLSEATARIKEAIDDAFRRGVEAQRKALRDYIHRLEALGEIKPSTLSNDAVVKGIILELRALAPPQEGP